MLVRSPVGAAVALAVAGSCGHPVRAAESEPGAAAQLDEIIVAARRRDESLQETPVAVSAFSGEALELRQVANIADVSGLVPNVQFDAVAPEAAGGGSSALSIRGIGQSDYVITIEPGVGVYLDDVYVSKSFGSLLETIDLERIEVLRGPQGTLFGKNTIGGAVVLTSRRPSREPEASAELRLGRFDRHDAKVTLSGPLSDGFRARLSAAYQQRDGFVSRPTTGETQGDTDRLAARLAAEWDITDSLLARLAVDHSRIREEVAGTVVLTIDDTAPFALYHNVVRFPQCNPFIPGNTARFADPNCYNSQFTSTLEERRNYSNGPNFADTDVTGLQVALEWSLGAVLLKSISAYREVEVESGQEVDNVPAFTGNIFQDYTTEQLSQELQLSGATAGERLRYVVGAFYLNESGRQHFPVRTDFVSFTTGGRIENDSYALFGQASYRITEPFSVTLGARFTQEDKSFLPQQQIDDVPPQFQAPIPEFGGAVFLPPVIPAAVGGQLSPFFQNGVRLLPEVWADTSDDQFTPMLSLDYRLSTDVLAYASWSRGFKGGGFTMRAFPPIIPGVTTLETDPEQVIPRFDPEEATQYELGLKSEWLDRRLRLNAAVFHIDYTDLQLTVLIGGFTPTVQNAGDARIRGIELESEFVATEWLRLNAAVGYLDAEYESLRPEAIAQGVTLDKMIPNAPEWSVSAGATADFFDNDRGRLYLRTDYSYRSEMAKDPANTAPIVAGSYDLLNASLNWDSAGGAWHLALGGTNLTDETYLVTGVFNSGGGFNYAYPSRPREWFVSARYRF